MNKLIFNDVGLWPHSLELCELSRYLLDTGNNVFFLSSNDSFFGNPANPLCNDFAKIITKTRNIYIHNELNKFKVNCSFIPRSNIKDVSFEKKVNQNLLDSIYGSYCEILCDGLANRRTSYYKNFEKKILLSIEKSSYFLDSFIKNNDIDEVIVWNGRRPAQVFLVNLAKLNFIKYSSVILSQISGRYAYKTNWPDVNDINQYSKVIFKKLDNFNKKGINENAITKSNLYFRRAQGLIEKPESFSSRGFYTYSEQYHNSKNLKEKISHLKKLNKKIVSIFPGTFLEYIALPSYSYDSMKKNHYEHINYFLSLDLDSSYHFILRFHPNQRLVKYNERSEIRKIINKASIKSNFDLILPQQNISSYQLIKYSDYVVSIGSSISVEALRMKKKVIFLGCNWFQELESLNKPKSEKDIIKLLNSDIKPNPNSYRDSILFVESLLDEDHLKFNYYYSLNQIIKKTIFNKYILKIAIALTMISLRIFRLRFLLNKDSWIENYKAQKYKF